MASLAEANTTFSLNLFKELTEEDKTGNVFYSPLSISSALAMVYLGARGNTATQMENVLGFSTDEKPKEAEPAMCQQMQQVQKPVLPAFLQKKFNKSEEDVHVAFRDLFSQLNKEGVPYSLRLANRLYGEQSYQFVEQYLHDTEALYKAMLETVDFKSNTEDARIKINEWVEKQTQDKIKDLLAEGTIDADTRLVLVNAIYFKGNWDKKFEESATKEVQFKLNKNNSTPVQMMHQENKFYHVFNRDINCQILELPYSGKDLSMLIILPSEIADDGTGLETLEGKLTYENFVEWTRRDMMEFEKVQVGLPRFKLEETYELKDHLVSMGMVDAFGTRCDLSGMSPSNDLMVSKVVHKSFVDVNEEGTEAAAATGVIITRRTAVFPPVMFIADHPFLFFIRYNPSKSILFAGRYSSP